MKSWVTRDKEAKARMATDHYRGLKRWVGMVKGLFLTPWLLAMALNILVIFIAAAVNERELGRFSTILLVATFLIGLDLMAPGWVACGVVHLLIDIEQVLRDMRNRLEDMDTFSSKQDT